MDGDGPDSHLATGAMNPQRDFSAIGDQNLLKHWSLSALSPRTGPDSAALLDQHQNRAKFYRLGVRDQDLRDAARSVGANLVHDLHCLDDQQRLVLGDGIAKPNKRWGSLLWCQIGGANDRRLDRTRVFDRSSGGGRRRGRGNAEWRGSRRRAGNADATITDRVFDLAQTGLGQ